MLLDKTNDKISASFGFFSGGGERWKWNFQWSFIRDFRFIVVLVRPRGIREIGFLAWNRKRTSEKFHCRRVPVGRATTMRSYESTVFRQNKSTGRSRGRCFVRRLNHTTTVLHTANRLLGYRENRRRIDCSSGGLIYREVTDERPRSEEPVTMVESGTISNADVRAAPKILELGLGWVRWGYIANPRFIAEFWHFNRLLFFFFFCRIFKNKLN